MISCCCCFIWQLTLVWLCHFWSEELAAMSEAGESAVTPAAGDGGIADSDMKLDAENMEPTDGSVTYGLHLSSSLFSNLKYHCHQ